MPAVKICDGSLLPAAHAVLIRSNSNPGSPTGGYVAGTSAAYENQALQNMLTYGYPMLFARSEFCLASVHKQLWNKLWYFEPDENV